jgi:hypothetical protein
MRIAAATFCSLILLTGGGRLAAQQSEPAKPKVPEKGDIILVKGCLMGPLLEATETSMPDETGLLAWRLKYQLKGDKNLVKQLREKFNGHLVEVTGVLKSKLPEKATRGKQVGKTRIVFGGPTTTQDQRTQMTDEPMPVLEVKSFEGFATICTR